MTLNSDHSERNCVKIGNTEPKIPNEQSLYREFSDGYIETSDRVLNWSQFAQFYADFSLANALRNILDIHRSSAKVHKLFLETNSTSVSMHSRQYSKVQLLWKSIGNWQQRRKTGLLELEWYTLSGRIHKVVASHAEGCKVARSNTGCGCAAPIYTMHEALRGYCPWGSVVRPVNWIYRLWRHCP